MLCLSLQCLLVCEHGESGEMTHLLNSIQSESEKESKVGRGNAVKAPLICNSDPSSPEF